MDTEGGGVASQRATQYQCRGKEGNMTNICLTDQVAIVDFVKDHEEFHDKTNEIYWDKWIFVRCTNIYHCKLKKKIENCIFGLLPPEPLGEAKPALTCFLSSGDAFQQISKKAQKRLPNKSQVLKVLSLIT